MSEYGAAELRGKMKDKARRRAAGEGPGKVDASSYEPPESMDCNVQTGMRPVSKQPFKRGGAVDGAKTQVRADRKPRKAGGGSATGDQNNNGRTARAPDHRAVKISPLSGESARARNDDPWPSANVSNSEYARYRAQGADNRPQRKSGGLVNEWVNRNDKDANEDRPGVKHDGGFADGGGVPTSRFAFAPSESRLSKAAGLKDGGYASARHGNRRTHRGMGGILEAVSPAYAAAKNPDVLAAVSPLAMALGAGKKKDRPERKAGGKTNINIIIGQPKSGGEPMPQAGPPMPPPPMMPKPPLPPGGPPPGLGAGPPMGAPVPMPPMGRKRGGRTYDAGAGSGEGRLEKAAKYGR